MNVLKEKVENTSDQTKVVMSSMTMSDGLETRGGLRENSSTLHKAKKIRKFKCAWCKKPFESIQAQAKFCCANHKMRHLRLVQALKRSKRLTPLARKGRHFKPHLFDIVLARDSDLHDQYLSEVRLSLQARDSQTHALQVEEQAD